MLAAETKHHRRGRLANGILVALYASLARVHWLMGAGARFTQSGWRYSLRCGGHPTFSVPPSNRDGATHSFLAEPGNSCRELTTIQSPDAQHVVLQILSPCRAHTTAYAYFKSG